MTSRSNCCDLGSLQSKRGRLGLSALPLLSAASASAAPPSAPLPAGLTRTPDRSPALDDTGSLDAPHAVANGNASNDTSKPGAKEGERFIAGSPRWTISNTSDRAGPGDTDDGRVLPNRDTRCRTFLFSAVFRLLNSMLL